MYVCLGTKFVCVGQVCVWANCVCVGQPCVSWNICVSAKCVCGLSVWMDLLYLCAKCVCSHVYVYIYMIALSMNLTLKHHVLIPQQLILIAFSVDYSKFCCPHILLFSEALSEEFVTNITIVLVLNISLEHSNSTYLRGPHQMFMGFTVCALDPKGGQGVDLVDCNVMGGLPYSHQ